MVFFARCFLYPKSDCHLRYTIIGTESPTGKDPISGACSGIWAKPKAVGVAKHPTAPSVEVTVHVGDRLIRTLENCA